MSIDVTDIGRFVAPAAMRDGREKRAVGLGQQAIERDDPAVSRRSAGLRERDDASERNVETEIKASARPAPWSL